MLYHHIWPQWSSHALTSKIDSPVTDLEGAVTPPPPPPSLPFQETQKNMCIVLLIDRGQIIMHNNYMNTQL